MKRLVLLSILVSACGPSEETTVQDLSVIRSLVFGREEPRGVTVGMNLDGFVSGANDGRSCNKEDFESPDGVDGIDNELARLLPLIDIAGENAVEALIQDSINEGRLMVMIELTTREDGTYGIRALRGEDVPLLGTDGRILESQTLGLSADLLLGEAEAKLEAGVIETEPFELNLPIIVFSQLYEVRMPAARLRFTLGPDAKIEDGLIAGGIPIDQLLVILRTASNFAGDFEMLFSDAIRESGDLDRDADGNCTAMSVGVAFDAVRAYTWAM